MHFGKMELISEACSFDVRIKIGVSWIDWRLEENSSHLEGMMGVLIVVEDSFQTQVSSNLTKSSGSTDRKARELTFASVSLTEILP